MSTSSLNQFKAEYSGLSLLDYVNSNITLNIPKSVAMIHNHVFRKDELEIEAELGDVISYSENMTAHVSVGVVIGFNPKSIRVMKLRNEFRFGVGVANVPGKFAVIKKKSANLVD